MKVRHARSLACLGVFSLAALMSVPAYTQSRDSGETRQTKPASSAQASTTAYTPEFARQRSAAAQANNKRKPRWFDERRQQTEESATTASFERLSYTRYEGEAGQASGSCVYYQSSYTYSCR